MSCLDNENVCAYLIYDKMNPKAIARGHWVL